MKSQASVHLFGLVVFAQIDKTMLKTMAQPKAIKIQTEPASKTGLVKNNPEH